MKKTLIALIALAGVALGADDKLLVEYDFTGDSPLTATYGTGGMQVYNTQGNTGHSIANGTLTMQGTNGFYSSSGAGYAIYKNTEVTNWSLTLNATLDSGGTCYSVLQLGGSETEQTPIGFYMGNGSDDRGLFGFEIQNGGRWGVVIPANTQLTLNYDNVATDYTISVYQNELRLEVGGIDVTSYLTRVDTAAGDTTFQQAFQATQTQGICWTKLGYASDVGGLAHIPSGGQIHNIAISIIPEPATATLSLLALAGLAARRRRK